MTAPGFLAVGGIEIANNARTVGYIARGLGGPYLQGITAQLCPDLFTEAFPLTVCPEIDTDDQYFVDPRPGYRVPTTGAVPTATGLRWDASGWVQGVGQTPATGGGFLPPNPGTVPLRVRLVVDVMRMPVDQRMIEIGRIVNAGTAQVGWRSIAVNFSAPNLELREQGRTPLGNSVPGLVKTVPCAGGTLIWFEALFSSTGIIGTLYGGDPDLGAPVMLQLASAYSGATSGPWWVDTGQTEAAAFAVVTEVGVVAFSNPFPLATDIVISELQVIPNPLCVTPALADLFPSDTLFPADDLWPGLYGEFHDPATDAAPWADVDRPEGYGYLGLIIDKIVGLDTTSQRGVDAAADGIGGIVGPETLDPRDVTVTGWLVASGCSAMEYARRWLAETLAASLCTSCDTSYADVRTTCGDRPTGGSFDTNRWRMYDVGLKDMTTDTSGDDCCYITPISFTLTAGDPYLYGPITAASGPTILNAGAADTPPVQFETWLFGGAAAATCTTVIDQGIGTDAAIFTFNGGSSGIEAGFVYQDLGLYPSDAIWPSDCLYPAGGVTPETSDDCPFVFSFSIGPGETFQVDNSRRRLVWTLADGTVMDGAPKMLMAPGDVIEWIDTCAGASITACVSAFAGCTCDDTASVTIQTQHKER